MVWMPVCPEETKEGKTLKSAALRGYPLWPSICNSSLSCYSVLGNRLMTAETETLASNYG